MTTPSGFVQRRRRRRFQQFIIGATVNGDRPEHDHVGQDNRHVFSSIEVSDGFSFSFDLRIRPRRSDRLDRAIGCVGRRTPGTGGDRGRAPARPLPLHRFLPGRRGCRGIDAARAYGTLSTPAQQPFRPARRSSRRFRPAAGTGGHGRNMRDAAACGQRPCPWITVGPPAGAGLRHSVEHSPAESAGSDQRPAPCWKARCLPIPGGSRTSPARPAWQRHRRPGRQTAHACSDGEENLSQLVGERPAA